MDKIEFLQALDTIIRQQITYGNQLMIVMAIDDILQYITSQRMDYGLMDFIERDDLYWEFDQGDSFCWCGADKAPYGFAISTFQDYTMNCEEIAHDLWEILYRRDENGNEVMGEEEGIEYATNMYEHFDFNALSMKYQNLEDMLADCEIESCIYEMHEEIFSYAHNFEENLTLLELIVDSGQDVDNECGSLDKHILSLECPALDSWVEFISSEKNRVEMTDMEKFQIMLFELENGDITYAMENYGIELNSFSTDAGHSEGWYRTIIHDSYCFYCSYEVQTNCLFAYGLISLRYLAHMLRMQDFLREMDEKYHYLICTDGGK